MDWDKTAVENFLATAHALADLAREQSLPWFRQAIETEFKADSSPVTKADVCAEAAMRRRLAELHPDHEVRGEELGSERSGAEWVWFLDPIDGTKSFISGIPLWGTLVALLFRDSPVIGVIDAPATNERWSAIQDTATWFCGDGRAPQRCRTSGCTQLAHARLCLPSPDTFDEHGSQAARRLSECARLNRFGGDCYSYGLLASGHLDVIVESGLDDHDFLPMVPIIEAADGVISDWEGHPLRPGSSGHVVAAASAALHREAVAQLCG